ncbi:MAG: hypothetical protein ABFS12_08115 [Bacteroidota bacterium]
MKSKLILICGIITSLNLFYGCSSSSAINDFFGIEMPPSEVDYFKIVGYTEFSGVSYQSTGNMNPNLYAWAGIEDTQVRIKITNNSDEPVKVNYIEDQYLLVEKEGDEFVLNKGDMLDYNNHDPIMPQGSMEIVLELPKDYLNALYFGRNDDFANDMTREQNTVFYDKERIKNLQIKLGYTKTIILKPVIEYTK